MKKLKKFLPILLVLCVLAIAYSGKMYVYEKDPALNSEIENIYLDSTTSKKRIAELEEGIKVKCGIINWLAIPIKLTGGTDYTIDGDWTDLDLTAHTSANAKFVLLILEHQDTCSANDNFSVRKNGTTPTINIGIIASNATQFASIMVTCAMDSGQVIEYYATDASDTKIGIVGYIE